MHEAYLKLVDQGKADWNSRGHFMAVAAKAMRQILVNYAERRRAAKRGGGHHDVTLDDSQGDSNPVTAEVADEVIALHKALEELAPIRRNHDDYEDHQNDLDRRRYHGDGPGRRRSAG